MYIKFDELINLSILKESNIEDYNEQFQLLKEAQNYLNSQTWCKNIIEGWWSVGWADKIAVFLFNITPISNQKSEFFWVVTGDIPPAYIDIKYAKNGIHALKYYCQIMQKWVETVYNGENVSDLFPINVPAKIEYADMLKVRLELINDEILSHYEDLLSDYKN